MISIQVSYIPLYKEQDKSQIIIKICFTIMDASVCEYGCPLGSEALDPLDLECQVVLSHSVWVQGI